MSLDIDITGETIVTSQPYVKPKPVINMVPCPEPPEYDEHNIYPIKPEIPKEVPKGDYISRCHYGALIINTRNIFIADVDIKKDSKYPQLRSKEAYTDYFIKMSRYLMNDFVLHETFGGFRVIMVSQTCNPKGKLSQAYMELFLADPLYAHNCIHQGCYRARLTPKPTRVGMKDFDKDLYKSEGKWLGDYSKNIKDFAVCRLKEASRKFLVNFCDEANQFLLLHNSYTINKTKPLA